MKKEAAALLSLIFLIPFANAQFSVADVFSFIDSQTVFLLIMFGILGLLFKKSLDRFPALRGTTAGIISVLVSIGATFGINKLINVNDLFLNLGLPSDFLTYLPIALLILFVISLFIFKWRALLILGLLLILISLFTDLVAEKEIVLITGIVLVLISLFWWWRRRRIPNPNIVNGMPRLVLEARAYRQQADRQQNPGMYRNWAHFIKYLKQRRYGNNEKEICQRMNVSQSDISRVVRKYIL